MKKKEKKQLIRFLIGLVILVILSITAYFNPDVKKQVNSLFEEEKQVTTTVTSFDLSSIPEYKDSPYVYINDNKPNFTEEDYTKDPKGHTIIGKNTTIGHSCVIHGCQIGNNCLIGMGSVIGDECIIEDNAFIGAASNLTPRTIVRSGEMWFGNPARFMRNLRAQDIEYMKKDVDIYLSLAYEFNKE